MIEVQFKLLEPGAITPTKAHPTDSGWDLYSYVKQEPCSFSYNEATDRHDLAYYCNGEPGYHWKLRNEVCGLPHLHIRPGKVVNVYTGIAVCPPVGWGYTIRPRSSLNKRGIHVLLGTVDATFTGPVYAVLLNSTSDDYVLKHGERVAQIVFEPVIDVQMKMVQEFDLPQGARGDKGWGSSGK